MSAVEEYGDKGPEIGQASADEQQMLQAVFSTLLERAASNGGSLTRRDIERVRTELSPVEHRRFERYSDAHSAIVAALTGDGPDGFEGDTLLDHMIHLYATDVIDELYPELPGEAGQTWRAIVMQQIETLICDWLVPNIEARLEVARRRVVAEHGEGFRGEDLIGDYEVIAIFRQVNRRLDEELRDGAEFGKVLCLDVNAAVRASLGARATREMFIGIREADTILENLVGAQYGNRFRMTVVDPS